MEKIQVQEKMSREVVTIGWKEKMETAFQRMRSLRLRHFPVMNDTGEVIGMLSDRDVQRAMISNVERDMGRITSDETIQFDSDSLVRDYMSWPVKAVDHRMELRAVVERMLVDKVSSLLVKKGECPVGIITTDDLMRVLIDILSEPKGSVQWNLEQVMEVVPGLSWERLNMAI